VSDLLDKCRRIDSLSKSEKIVRPGAATMLFYGPPGTGKSALARYLSQELDRELFVRRASDLMDKYVGGTERRIADAFGNIGDSILLIDEADSLLYSRDTAVRSWESSFVNEFLTSLEECRGFCICTTNRLQNIDAAALRRFSFKIPFCYAKPEQISALYKSILAPLASGKLADDERKRLLGISGLAPGDFNVVRSQYWFAQREEVSHRQLIDALCAEQRAKEDYAGRRVGF
jgi:SpoVK/Ycf46/Vps4 family AAA+-type ATPase